MTVNHLRPHQSRRRQRPPQNIIITHVYSSDNKGDAALTSVLISDLKRTFKNARITILKLESVAVGHRFEGISEEPGFMYYALNRYSNPFLKLAYSLYMMAATLAWAASGKRLYLPAHLRKVADLYAKADLIVPVGGGYLRSRSGWLNRCNIPLLLHPLLFGYLLGKPTVLYAQSMGPFVNNYERLLVAFALKKMALIILREDTSAALLATMGVTNNIVRSVDSGFLLHGTGKLDVRKQYHIPADKPLLGVTVRSWLVGEAQITYEKAIAEMLDNLVEKFPARILFIPQVTATKGDDDRIVSRRVHAYMQHGDKATTIEDEPDHHQIKDIYDELDVLLGTRFHSVIFSLTSYVPVLAIEYEHKTSGIMHDLKLDKWVIKIEDVSAQKLIVMMDKLIYEQDTYREHLLEHLPPYIQKAEQTAGLLETSYYSWQAATARDPEK